MSKSFVVFLLVVLCSKNSRAQIDYKGFPQWSWNKQDSTEYYLYTPSATNKTGLFPIVLFLHGCCGESYHATLRNTVDPPVRMWHNFGANTQKEPTYIISPATSRGWKQHIPNLKRVMDDLVKNHQGDPKRIYITGFSMGASGTWEFLQQYPGYFAAALPMGMNFQGDRKKVKDIPTWTNRGETDYYARNLPADVWEIRKLNGDNIDSNQNWVTGVNPRFTSFQNYGHGVQWVAASTQDLTGWAYSKVNDGNIYPVVFFKNPTYKQIVLKGSQLKVEVQASDPDGSISKIVIRVNGREHAQLLKEPFTTTILAPAGDVIIEATAYDDKGKTSTATTLIKSDTKTRMLTLELPFARQGAFYEKQLSALGNGAIEFSLGVKTSLPAGLGFNKNGVLSGIPQTAGYYAFEIVAKDEDGDSAMVKYSLSVQRKNAGEILVSNIINDSGVHFPVSKLRLGVPTHFNKDDDEVTISNTAGYEGMTYIQGNAKDTNRTSTNYLSFDIDEDARVYVAYEKKDHLSASTIPQWLQKWHKEPAQQIVAQYFYYDIYYKDFPKGKVILPGADEKRNNISKNYFVLVRKVLSPFQFAPAINTAKLNEAFLNIPYKEQITALYGSGKLVWRVTKGTLPKGLQLSPNGSLSGTPETKGSFSFRVSVKDNNNKVEKDMMLVVKHEIK